MPAVLSNVAHGKGQAEAQARCGYGPITIRREGEDVVVEAELDGVPHEVIREPLNSNFCHTVYPRAILDIFEGRGA